MRVSSFRRSRPWLPGHPARMKRNSLGKERKLATCAPLYCSKEILRQLGDGRAGVSRDNDSVREALEPEGERGSPDDVASTDIIERHSRSWTPRCSPGRWPCAKCVGAFIDGKVAQSLDSGIGSASGRHFRLPVLLRRSATASPLRPSAHPSSFDEPKMLDAVGIHRESRDVAALVAKEVKMETGDREPIGESRLKRLPRGMFVFILVAQE